MTDEDSPVQFKYTGARHGYVVGVTTHVIYTIRVYYSQLCDSTVAWFWMWERPSARRRPKYSLLFEVYVGVDCVCVYRLNKRGCLNTSKARTLGWGNILAYLVHWG